MIKISQYRRISAEDETFESESDDRAVKGGREALRC